MAFGLFIARFSSCDMVEKNHLIRCRFLFSLSAGSLSVTPPAEFIFVFFLSFNETSR